MIQLDILRGIAILLVLARHSPIDYNHAGRFAKIFRALWWFGWTGVDLFFVLSGFLIGGLLFKEILATGRLRVWRFLVRRGFKIWPPYFIYIAYVVLRDGMIVGDRASFHAVIPNLLHLQNYLGSPRGQTWSLAVEEHFYLALPLLLLVLLRFKRLRALPSIAVAVVVICTMLRVLTKWHRPFVMYTDLTATHLRVDGLFFGVLLAYGYHATPAFMARLARHRAVLLVTGLVLISPMAMHDISDYIFYWTFGYTLLYLGYGAILLAMVYTPAESAIGRAFTTPPARLLAYIGLFSYSIYLWQFDLGNNPVRKWILPRLPEHPVIVSFFIGSVAYYAATILTGIVAAKLIEIPTIAWRDRFFPPTVRGSSVDRSVE